MLRFIILEHTGAPDDPAGRHFDLLLEDGDSCRSWRLAVLPKLGGPAVETIELAPHRLSWLDHEAGEVSGGRGFARRIDAGRFEPAPAPVPNQGLDVDVTLHGDRLRGRLVLRDRNGRWSASLS